MQMNTRYLALPLILRMAIALIVCLIIIIALQNPQIFPGASLSLLKSTVRDQSTLPKDVESIFIQTSDHKKLEAWRLPVKAASQIAVIFHGNGGDVANFFPYQQFFQKIGITSYGFDYRGYGKSSGWPTESGLYRDAEAIVQYVMMREQVTPENLIIVGISVGSGPATYIANQLQPKTLIFYSPFKSLKEAVKSQPIIGFLHPFLIYKFPVIEHMKNLKDSCVIIVHGTKDNIIPIKQGRAIYEEHQRYGESYFIEAEGFGHNDLLNSKIAADKVQQYLLECKSR